MRVTEREKMTAEALKDDHGKSQSLKRLFFSCLNTDLENTRRMFPC